MSRIGELLESEDIEIDEKILYANANYLVKKGLIERPLTSQYLTKITINGILEIENTLISPDIKIRRKILEHLREIFNVKPRRRLKKRK